MDDGSNSVIDPKPSLVPYVEGKEYGVLREELDAFLKRRSDHGRFE